MVFIPFGLHYWTISKFQNLLEGLLIVLADLMHCFGLGKVGIVMLFKLSHLRVLLVMSLSGVA